MADVKLPPIFGDHMVLQQAKELPVWGTADVGESVTVTVGGHTGTAVAGADGKWMVKLAPLSVSTTPVDMTVEGKNKLTFQDVLVGEVWLCSGQSNMEIGFTILDGDYSKFNRTIHPNPQEAIAQANVPLLRFFAVPKVPALAPIGEMKEVADKPDIAHWEVCTPDSITKTGVWGGFSAVGYFFGREIQKSTGAPVGLIGAYWGGTPAEAWISSEGLAKDTALAEYVTKYQAKADAYAKAEADYPAQKTAYDAALAKWNQDNPSQSKDQPKPPAIPGIASGTPTALFNGIISPIIPYGIRGAIWYQGESNAGNEHSSKLYQALFSDMITDWRQKFNEGDFPFLYVQLAAFKPAKYWPFLRESQLKTLSLPNVGMASAVDIGDPACIHPGDKLSVGLRLALAADHLAYGKEVVYSGPIYDKMRVDKDGIHLSFTNLGSGLVIGSAPTYATGLTPPPADKLTGFLVAGNDQHWFPAEAKIDGAEVLVSSPQVPNPVAVRYAWEPLPTINLYNKEGLPASPFRTDDWEDPTP